MNHKTGLTTLWSNTLLKLEDVSSNAFHQYPSLYKELITAENKYRLLLDDNLVTIYDISESIDKMKTKRIYEIIVQKATTSVVTRDVPGQLFLLGPGPGPGPGLKIYMLCTLTAFVLILFC